VTDTVTKPLYRRRVGRPSALVPLSRALICHLRTGMVVTLTGDLGAGKTTFVRAIGRELGVPPAEIRSPSFTLVNEYRGRWPVYHIDLYRLGDAAELAGLGFDDMLDGPGICFVEWPGLAARGLQRRGVTVMAVEVAFTGRGAERLVTVWPPSP